MTGLDLDPSIHRSIQHSKSCLQSRIDDKREREELPQIIEKQLFDKRPRVVLNNVTRLLFLLSGKIFQQRFNERSNRRRLMGAESDE